MAKKRPDKNITLKNLKKFLSLEPCQDSRPTVVPEPEAVLEEEPLSFEEEMERLGVKPDIDLDSLDPQEVLLKEEESFSSDVEKDGSGEDQKDQELFEQTDQELFLSALKNFDKVFEEEDLSGIPPVSTSGRLKTFRKKKIIPEKTIDLHGMTRQEALQKVRYFLENAAYEGMKTVLIITGRGNSSEGEAVLRTAVTLYLERDAGRWVTHWEKAPRKWGGEGAVVAFLRSRAL